MPDIFISHVEEDASFAIDIAHAMECIGFSTWYYERDTVPGRSYLLQIGEEIDVCRAIILLISSHSLGSYQVRQEVIRAYESNKPFMPLLIDISHAEFQTRQPEWRAALGATASLRIPHEGIGPIVPQLAKGLAALGLQPVEPGTIRTASTIEAQHQEHLRAVHAEAQRQQGTERTRQQEQCDEEAYEHKRHKRYRAKSLWVGGSITFACFAFVLISLSQKPSPTKPVVEKPVPTPHEAQETSGTPYQQLQQLVEQMSVPTPHEAQETFDTPHQDQIKKLQQEAKKLQQWASEDAQKTFGNPFETTRNSKLDQTLLLYMNQGVALATQGDKKGAIENFQRAADLYRQLGKTSEYQMALNQIKEFQRTPPGSTFKFQLPVLPGGEAEHLWVTTIPKK